MFDSLAQPFLDSHPFVRAAWRTLHFYLRAQHRITISGRCPIPLTGPAILVCNHISGLDPLILQAAGPRLVRWMMAREYYEHPLGKWFFRRIGAIPVDRTGRDLASARAAIRALGAGGILGVFPEGHIAAGRDVESFQTGVALMAIRANVPVYPAHIEGTMRDLEMPETFLYSHRAVVSFGAAVAFDRADTSRRTIEAATAAIHSAVRELGARNACLLKTAGALCVAREKL